MVQFTTSTVVCFGLKIEFSWYFQNVYYFFIIGENKQTIKENWIFPLNRGIFIKLISLF